MARAMRKATELGLEAIAIEGGLIAPEQVAAIAATARDAKSAAGYDVPKGLTLGEEIARYFRIGQAIWRDYDRIDAPTVTQTAEFADKLLSQAFGFDDLTGPHDHHDGTRRYRIAREARQGRVPVVVAAPATDDKGRDVGFTKALPEFGDGVEGRARRSPIVLLQDWLNANPQFYWGLVFAGDRVRLMRDNASLTRQAWIEADLGAIFRDEMFADFTAWWLLTHASRFGAAGTPASSAPLEQAREAGLKQGTAARERLREGVETALAELGQGLVEANPTIRQRLASDAAATSALFEELLRTVYRLIFLAVAEDRDLLHPRTTGRQARDLYAENYGFAFWRQRSTRLAAYDAHHDAWEGIKVTLAALEHGQSLLGLPALGGLFVRDATPTLEQARIPNRRMLRAIYSLGFIQVAGQRHRINWRDMKTEELGSVYESLLEIRPRLTPAGEFELDSGAKGNARKTTGSYYTPDSLVETLLDSALDPVLDKAEAEGGADAILDLRVIDPACGSGHFLLGAARRMADRVAALRDPDAPDTQAALRDVVSRCIHGVDRNPMAVELAKVALWIESVSPGQPLGFLDANIRCGDALLGVFDLDALEQGIPDEAYKPLTGDDKAAAKYYLQQNRAARKGQGTLDFHGGGGAMPPRKLAANLATIKRLPEDTVGQVEEKKRRFEAWRNDPARWATKVACDLYIAAFLLPKTEVPEARGRDMVPTTADVRRKLGGGSNYGPMEAAAVDAAEAARPLHWPLAFPDVMVERGGFDVVLGNPPWERIKLQEQEFFAGTEIADTSNAAARTKAIADLANAELGTVERALFDAYESAKRSAEAATEFIRTGQRFELSASGDINTYALFADLAFGAAHEEGRVGIILPSGLVSDYTNRKLFGHLVEAGRIVSSFGFENSEGLFPAVHPDTHFILLTLGSNESEISFTSRLSSIEHLQDSRRVFRLTGEQISAINPSTGVAPVLRSVEDAKLISRIYERVPILSSPGQGDISGHLVLRTMFHKTNGFKAGDLCEIENGSAEQSLLPCNEGEFGYIFDHRYSTLDGESVRPTTEAEHSDPDFEPNLIVAAKKASFKAVVERWELPTSTSCWLAIRRVSNAANDRTSITVLLPFMPLTNSWIVTTGGTTGRVACVAANYASLVFDYCLRTKLTQPSIPQSTFDQLPILPTTAYTEADLAFIVPRVLELTYTSHSMAPFARDLGYEGPPFAWDEARRAQLRAELDAWYALAYSLTRDELRYVLDPKDVMGADYPSETFRVLQNNENKQFGEYRTRRLVLAAYDALVAAAPETATLPDGQWQGSIADEPDVRLLLAAIIKRMRQPRTLREVTFAFLYAAQPHLLTPRLSASAATEWQRLVGNAAALPVSQSVPTFSSAQLKHFGTAQSQLAARRAWRYDVATATVDRGAAIYEFPLPPWTEARADFVWYALRSIDLDAATSALSQLEQSFIAQAAAA